MSLAIILCCLSGLRLSGLRLGGLLDLSSVLCMYMYFHVIVIIGIYILECMKYA